MAITSYPFRGSVGDNKFNGYMFAVKSNGKMWGACMSANSEGDGLHGVNHYMDVFVKRINDDYTVGADITAFHASGPIDPATSRYGYSIASLTDYTTNTGINRIGVSALINYTEDPARPLYEYVRPYFKYTDNEFDTLSDPILMADASWYIFGDIIQLNISKKLVAVGYDYVPANPSSNYCLFISEDYGLTWSTVALPSSSNKWTEPSVIELKDNGVYTANGKLGIFARSYLKYATVGLHYATLIVDSLGNVTQGWSQPDIPFPQDGPIRPQRLSTGKIIMSDGINPIMVRETNDSLDHFHTVISSSLDVAVNVPHSDPLEIDRSNLVLAYATTYIDHSETYTGTGFDISVINNSINGRVEITATASPGATGLLYTGSNNQFHINLEQMSTAYKNNFFAAAYTENNVAVYDSAGNKLPRKMIRFDPYSKKGWIVFKTTSSSTQNVVVKIAASSSINESNSTDIGDFQHDWGFYGVKGNAVDDKGNANLTVEPYITLGHQYPWEGGSISEFNPKIGSSYRFLDASALKVYHATAMQVERTQAWTVLFWYQPESYVGYKEILSTLDGAGSLGLRIYSNSGGCLACTLGDANKLEAYSNDAIFSNYGYWYCVAVSYDGSSDVSGLLFRANKSNLAKKWEVNTLNASILSGHAMYIGSRDGVTGTRVNGFLGPIKVAYRVMSTNEIDQHYNNITNSSFWTFSNMTVSEDAAMLLKSNRTLRKRRGLI